MRIAACLLLAASCASLALADEWTHWRGPNYTGAAEARGLPAEFDAETNVRWRAALPGPGESTPVSADGRIFLTARMGNDLLGVCIDHATGKTLWTFKFGEAPEKTRDRMVSCSPVTDGRHVWFLFANTDLACVNVAGDRQVWRRNLREDFGEYRLLFGYAASPLLVDGRIYVAMINQGGQSYVLAVDARTGETAWKTNRDTEARGETRDSYSSPVPVKLGDATGIVVAGADVVTCHAAADGEEVWRFRYHPGSQAGRLVPTVAIEDGVMVGVRARGQGAYAADLSKAVPELLWQASADSPDVASPILHDGLAYVLDGEKKRLHCLAARTGEKVWTAELGARAPFWASPTLADGKIYCVSKRGEFRCVSAGRDGGEVLSQFSLDQRDCIATPVVVGDTLLVRTPAELICVAAE